MWLGGTWAGSKVIPSSPGSLRSDTRDSGLGSQGSGSRIDRAKFRVDPWRGSKRGRGGVKHGGRQSQRPIFNKKWSAGADEAVKQVKQVKRHCRIANYRFEPM